MVENFDEWLAICQIFPYKPLSLNVSPLKPTINLSKFHSLNVNDSFVKVFPNQTFAPYGMTIHLSNIYLYKFLVVNKVYR